MWRGSVAGSAMLFVCCTPWASVQVKVMAWASASVRIFMWELVASTRAGACERGLEVTACADDVPTTIMSTSDAMIVNFFIKRFL